MSRDVAVGQQRGALICGRTYLALKLLKIAVSRALLLAAAFDVLTPG